MWVKVRQDHSRHADPMGKRSDMKFALAFIRAGMWNPLLFHQFLIHFNHIFVIRLHIIDWSIMTTLWVRFRQYRPGRVTEIGSEGIILLYIWSNMSSFTSILRFECFPSHKEQSPPARIYSPLSLHTLISQVQLGLQLLLHNPDLLTTRRFRRLTK